MPSSISGVENRISEARERHQDLHRANRQNVANWRALANSYSTAIEAFNEASEELVARANTALALSALACTISAVSVIVAATRR